MPVCGHAWRGGSISARSPGAMARRRFAGVSSGAGALLRPLGAPNHGAHRSRAGGDRRTLVTFDLRMGRSVSCRRHAIRAGPAGVPNRPRRRVAGRGGAGINQVKLTTVAPLPLAEETAIGHRLPGLCLASWVHSPDPGHLWLGRRSKGLVFLIALPADVRDRHRDPAAGCFPFGAERSAGLPWPRWADPRDRRDVFHRRPPLGYGSGDVRAGSTYEYGNAFLNRRRSAQTCWS